MVEYKEYATNDVDESVPDGRHEDLRCTQCGGWLHAIHGTFTCTDCSQQYGIIDGIPDLDVGADVDLRICDELLDMHALRSDRCYHERTISSDVEYVARAHSLKFAAHHAVLSAFSTS